MSERVANGFKIALGPTLVIAVASALFWSGWTMSNLTSRLDSHEVLSEHQGGVSRDLVAVELREIRRRLDQIERKLE